MIARVRTSVVVVKDNKLLTFLAVDPLDGREFFFLPGGKIEDDETAPEAAERETFEETGYRVQVQPESNIDREYQFYWNGEMYDCLTIFYRATLVSPMQKQVKDADYNKGARWIPVNEITSAFAYSEPIRQAVEDLIHPQD